MDGMMRQLAWGLTTTSGKDGVACMVWMPLSQHGTIGILIEAVRHGWCYLTNSLVLSYTWIQLYLGTRIRYKKMQFTLYWRYYRVDKLYVGIHRTIYQKSVSKTIIVPRRRGGGAMTKLNALAFTPGTFGTEMTIFTTYSLLVLYLLAFYTRKYYTKSWCIEWKRNQLQSLWNFQLHHFTVDHQINLYIWHQFIPE